MNIYCYFNTPGTVFHFFFEKAHYFAIFSDIVCKVVFMPPAGTEAGKAGKDPDLKF